MKVKIRFKEKARGILPEQRKHQTKHRKIEEATVPEILIFPLRMHIGKPARPLVEVGDEVKIGTLLAQAEEGISANVVSSVSGTVMTIGERPTVNGPTECIVVRNDFQDTKEAPLVEEGKDLSPQEKLEVIRKAGIVGMGGATFPTDIKAKPSKDKPIDTIIINGVECELYSTADHLLMLEQPEGIIAGAKILQEILQAKRVIIALENDAEDCVPGLLEAGKDFPGLEIKLLPVQYPQGAEKVLIKNLTGREVPTGGKLPADVRTFVCNVATARAIHEAVTHGKPLTERVTTLTGEPVQQPKNLRVRIGTPINSLIEDCQGFRTVPGKLLHGGPMMGKPLASAEVPVTKGTSVVTFLQPEEVDVGERSDCIRCSECLNVCPVSLQPILISNAYEKGDIEEAERLGAMDCIECGNCSFICPSKIPLLENIRAAKSAIKTKNAG